MTLFSRISLVVALVALVSGCATQAPVYNPNFENTQYLRGLGLAPATVARFTAASPDLESLTIRASTYVSPYRNSFAALLEEAIRRELTDARMFDEKSPIEVGGTLTANSIESGLAITGSADMSARIVVKRDGKVVYDKVHSAHHEWESSFLGAIAIPKAQQEYPNVIRKLATGLWRDPAFQAALRK